MPRNAGRRTALVAALIVVLAAACGGGSSTSNTAPDTTATVTTLPTTPASTAEPTLENLTVPAPSLDGNLLGDPSEVDIAVQLPASYVAESARRYPVVYFLAGYDEDPAVASIGTELERLVVAGAAPEMILVAVSGDNALGGSFYVDSPVSGRWASAIVDDVVPAIDERYRTLSSSASRGIAGFSMGGYGALALAMDHPDIFGAVYALSPGLFAPGGLAQSQMFADPAVVADVIAGQTELAAANDGDQREVVEAMARSGDARFSTAYGVAFAPDPAGPPPWMRYPLTEAGGAPDPEVWQQWENGYGGIATRVDAARDELMALRGVVLDVGSADEYAWVSPGTEHLHRELERAGVPHRYEVYPGGHGPVGPRAREVMLPFFAEVLDTASSAA